MDIRKRMIQDLRDLIESNKDLPVEQVLALFCIRTGVTMNKAREYYQVLVDAGLVEEK